LAAATCGAASVPAGAASLRVRAPRPAGAAAHAETARRPAGGSIGSSNVATADPPVPRPDTKPCVVPLFSGDTFADFTPKVFAFAPPAACPRPWAKVVLDLDLSVDAGRQFDRTATIGLGGANIFFGTTAEPGRTLGPSWHVERDLTDLSALFGTAQSGQISIGNVVNSTYTSSLHGSAQLEFYPPDRRFPAPRTADVVVPLADLNGNPVLLKTTASALSVSFTPPANVERAELDVIAQSQSNDEFWYTCFPNDLATLLNNCGNTAFRETEVAVDGKPAGVAPVYPWIFTGGIDPYLWRPIPGVQTLNFKPYRVDLSPFAGALDDGATHAVSLSVFNADDYFQATGNLLLFLDRGARTALSGKVDTDTLSAVPVETVKEGGSFDSSGIGAGTIDTASRRSYTIVGHVKTSHGLLRSEVDAWVAFRQHQDVTSTATGFVQNINQDTTIATSSSSLGAGGFGGLQQSFDWPLVLKYSYQVATDGSAAQTTSVDQAYSELKFAGGDRFGRGGFASFTKDRVTPADTLNFDATGALTSFTNNSSSQTYVYRDTNGACYGKRLTSAAGVLTSAKFIGCR
jgi:hypothetical protein